MLSLALRFLGTFHVSLADQPVSRFRSANVQGLLVYLALQVQRPFPRDVLAALFWPEEPDRIAKKNLRQTVYQLRQVLHDDQAQEQPHLLVTRQTVQFNPASRHTLDARQFLIALDQGDWATAVSLYNGDLLPGFTCDSLEFDDWLRRERERLHGLALKVMSDLAERQLRNGRVSKAQTTARRHLSLESWSESGHRHLMAALALAGDRPAALAQYERCRQILAEEMDILPEAETVALAERIQNDELEPVDPDLIAGRYVLGAEIGRGAMGVVRRGRDRRTGEVVAIKLLEAAVVAEKPDMVARFQQEGEALRRLNHPNIVKLLAMDEKNGRHTLVMEYISGGDLRQLLQKDNLPPLEQVLTIALDLADALTRAHRLDILHRDIKPGNVLLDDDGLPRLADFGLARLGQESLLTGHSSVMGTVAYLSPEACLGEDLDARSDVWSFGVLLVEMLLGERPFSAPNAAGTLHHILHTPLPDVSALRPDIPETVVDLLYRMLRKNRADRIPSVRLVGAELEVILQDRAWDAAAALRTGLPAPGRPSFATPTPERLMQARHNLPGQTTPFVGRELELAELDRLLADPVVRLVTILGPGGMGKTRLSLEIGGRLANGTSATQIAFPDGIVFVELASVTSVEQMMTAVAAALGFAIEKGLEPQQQLLNFLSNKRLLLLLDNFEQLLTPPLAAAGVITAVLQTAPQVKIIVTSRQKLNLSSEVLCVLGGLAFPDWQTTADALSYSAVQLFVQSARRSRIDFNLDAAALPQVARICRLTEGMPLGIVLAAAWVDMLSPAEIADEMAADIDFLAGEMGDLPPRQRSMRAVFAYSWELLTEQEQQVLARLSVFRDGFTREAAQKVAGATLRQLLALVNKSLVQRDVGDGRFSLHELLRQLAAEKLKTKSETDTIRTGHSHYYLSWLVGLKDDLYKYKQLETVHKLRRDEQNLQATWLWAAAKGEISQILSVMQPFPDYIMMTGREYGAMRLYKQTLQLLPPGDSTFTDTTDDATFVRACLLNRLQDMGFDQDEKEQPIDIDRLYAFFQVRGVKLEEALVCQHLAHRALREQNYPQATAYFQKQTEIYEQENEVFRLPLSLGRVAMLALFAGQIDDAFTLGQRAATVAKQYDNQLTVSTGLFLLAIYTLFDKNDYVTAKEQFAEVTALAFKHWSDGLNAITVMGSVTCQGFIALLLGELTKAQQFSQKMVEIAAVRNNPRDKLRADALEGLIQATMGQYEAVNVSALDGREGGVLLIGPIGITLTAYGQGKHHVAMTKIVQAWSVPITMRWPSILLQYMPVVASLLADQGEFSRAAALLAMGRAHPGCPRGWWEIMALVQELEARLQAELSAEEYAAAQARGREMDVGETAVTLLEELKAMQA